MKLRWFFPLAVLVTSLALQAQAPSGTPLVRPDEPSGEYPLDLKESMGLSVPAVAPEGGVIDIAADGENPAVALCASNQYLVVYEKDTDSEIYGQRLDSDGNLLGSAFQITDNSSDDTNPDVACDWYYNRFIVVWEHDYGDTGDLDIRVQGVYGGHQTSGSQVYGGWHAVSQDEPQIERNPAIACNSNEHTCLVVFGYDDNAAGVDDVYGQRVSVGTSDTAIEGSRFTIGDYAAPESIPRRLGRV